MPTTENRSNHSNKNGVNIVKSEFLPLTTQRTGIVVIDDDIEMQAVLKEFFEQKQYVVTCYPTGGRALEALISVHTKGSNNVCDLILCDLKLPDIDGLELLQQLKQYQLSQPVVMITAHASTETAVQAMAKGAFDYVTKPINFVELEVIVERAIRLCRLEIENKTLQSKVARSLRLDQIIGKSDKMQKLFNLIERVAPSNSNILISGESGTGKELVARTIHNKSTRVNAPFIAINCTAIPDTLLESELFGHVKGAFTGATDNRRGLFEEANQGTLFLDEIGDMPLSLQAKLLRVIQERKVKPLGANKQNDIDCRIIAATHQDLRRKIADGTFREDLYYRLCVIPVDLPALRERKEDIPILADHFLKKYAAINKSSVSGFSKEALAKLLAARWTGNVRELENTVERAVVLCQNSTIALEDLQFDDSGRNDNKIVQLFSDLISLEQLERAYLEYVLIHTENRKEKAAEILGINRKTLYRKEREYGIALPERREFEPKGN